MVSATWSERSVSREKRFTTNNSNKQGNKHNRQTYILFFGVPGCEFRVAKALALGGLVLEEARALLLEPGEARTCWGVLGVLVFMMVSMKG